MSTMKARSILGNCRPPPNVTIEVTLHFIDDIHFDPASGELNRRGTIVRLEPQPAAVLTHLAAHPGQLITHDELRAAIWGESTHVKLQDALHYCIRQIRAALNDLPRDARFIETIPRRGYRLRTDCLAPPTAESPRAAKRTIAARDFRWWARRAAIAAALVIGVVAAERRPNNHHEIAVRALHTLHDLIF